MTARNKRQIGYAISFVTILAALTAAGGSYLLSYALRPEAFIRERTASARESMLRQYPFLGPWIDSLEQHGALRDTVIRGQEGERLHAVYAPAPNPTSRTAVIVHGYTDCAERMLMIGYLYHHNWGSTSCFPTCITTAKARAAPSAWGGSTGSTCCAGWRSPTGFSAATRRWSSTASRWAPPRG